MAVANRILNIVILLMAIVAVAFGWKLYDRRKELRARGDLFAKTISQTAQVLDDQSPEQIADELQTDDTGGQGKLGWAEFHNDYKMNSGQGIREKMKTFTDQAESIRKQRDNLSEYIVGIAADFDHDPLQVTDLNDPAEDKSVKQLAELKNHLGEYYKRDKFLTASLKGFHEQLYPDSALDVKELMQPENYHAAQSKVKEGISHLQDMNQRYSNALSTAVSKLGGEERLGVTPEKIREVNPADVESMIKGIEKIMDTVAEVENLRVQIKAVEEQLAKAKDELDRANEEIAKHLIKIDSLKKLNEGLNVKVAKLQGIINSMKGGPLNPQSVGRHFDGKVKKVNYDYNYVIIDIGGKDKIVYGTQLTVARDREFICNVVVTKVYKNFAVAEIMPENKQGEVIEGDRVVALE